MESRGGQWLGIRGEGTFRRTNGNRVQESTLDMAWQGPEDDWQVTEQFSTGSNHKAISFQTSAEETSVQMEAGTDSGVVRLKVWIRIYKRSVSDEGK